MEEEGIIMKRIITYNDGSTHTCRVSDEWVRGRMVSKLLEDIKKADGYSEDEYWQSIRKSAIHSLLLDCGYDYNNRNDLVINKGRA